jgi:hypothetical protein
MNACRIHAHEINHNSAARTKSLPRNAVQHSLSPFRLSINHPGWSAALPPLPVSPMAREYITGLDGCQGAFNIGAFNIGSFVDDAKKEPDPLAVAENPVLFGYCAVVA